MDKQSKWDKVKHTIQLVSIHHSKSLQRKSQRAMMAAQQKRHEILNSLNSSQQSSTALSSELQNLELQISDQLIKRTKALSIRSATRWYEKGERSNEYFFKVIKQRSQSVSISAIRHQENGQIFTQTEDILQCAKDFYQKLFDSEPIDHRSLQIMLDELDGCPKLDAKDCEKLNAPISLFELTDTIERSPKGRSPGLDGLPFEVYPLLMKHKFTRDLLQDVMIDAMKGIFPESWKKTKLILLYKKGEATNLANWRPLSMINSDAKIFTKIMSRRLLPSFPNSSTHIKLVLFRED
jgi:hypothetical protein